MEREIDEIQNPSGATASGGQGGGGEGPPEPPSEENQPLHKRKGWFENLQESGVPGEIEAAGATEIFRRKLEGKKIKDQLKLVRGVLEDIEGRRERLKTHIDSLGLLNGSIDVMHPPVEREVKARLHLHECFVGVKNSISGKSEDMTANLRKFATEAQAENYLLGGRDFNTLLVEGLGGMRVRDAFYILQKIAHASPHGLKLSEEQIWLLEARAVQELIEAGAGKPEAEKSLELAKRIAEATFESSVWNKDTAPLDPMAEAIYFQTHRRKEAVDKGPVITINEILGFGTSFFRQLQNSSKENIFRKEDWQKARKSRGLGAIARIMRLQRIEPTDQDIDEFTLRFEGVNFMEAAMPGEYGGYLSSYIPGVLRVKDLLLKEDFELGKDLTRGAINSMLGPFKKADPDGRLNLHAYFALGFVDESLRQGVTLGWDASDVATALNRLSEPHVDLETGKQVSFITEAEKKWIVDETKPLLRGAANAFFLALEGVVRTRKR